MKQSEADNMRSKLRAEGIKAEMRGKGIFYRCLIKIGNITAIISDHKNPAIDIYNNSRLKDADEANGFVKNQIKRALVAAGFKA